MNANYILLSPIKQDSLLKAAHEFLFTTITTDFFSHWYNTPWSFYGQTRIPGEGHIACGYFVTTVLSDAGFNIPRIEWAQLASETMILKMTSDFKRFPNRPLKEVIQYINSSGDGLYIVGLDNHVGFIFRDGNNMKFVHSNYYQPETGVMAQEPDTDNPLKNSRYRVAGKILGDEMIKKWILNEKTE